MSSPLNRDFYDLLHAFVERDVRFLIVGAYALAVHGRPRATGDLGIWLDSSPANAAIAYRALAAFGAPLDDLTEADLATPGVVFQIGVAPARIDILTEISGVEFEATWPRRIEGRYGELVMPVIGREDFLTNKRATGRARDALDAELLEELGDGRS